MRELEVLRAGLNGSELGGFGALLDLTPLTEITGPYALVLGLIALYWLLRVGREARLGYLPGVAWWAVPGLALLLLTPTLDVPALFGLGAAALLLAEFWPLPYRRAPRRPSPAWPLVSVLIGVALAFSILQVQRPEPLAFVAALCALLAGMAGLLGAALYPARGAAPKASATLNFQTRWHRTVTPEWPDLSVTLSEQGAHLKNISPRPVRLAGWSPAGINAWFRVRGPDGEVLSELRVGQEALLPVGERDSGVRVWYGPDKSPEAHLFRADWTPVGRAEQRVLN
ncbi:hypothetical protein ACFP9V_17060 [Deinococcus radiopugnans]|uniref:Uncharacterized protein n=1 Tax=Deinococcus radiopugnans ATCC 19172 TaxID=585398 RepID=A0ABR6NRR7_9DEIO|nr:hypothetical protein [Deinococcus radiopugnans]MBB6016724.1 hypothetical protein [Deinococcus radiopugnans ATCC 19172]